jgi:hypothetical protein
MAHVYLDPLWNTKRFTLFKSRQAAYNWWSAYLVPAKHHVGDLTATECKTLINGCVKKVASNFTRDRLLDYLEFCKFQADNWKVKREIALPTWKKKNL